MTTRDAAPIGAPCWADLWTSDVEGSRRFYGRLFEWEAGEPSPEFGGYFMFTRTHVPVAGGMGPMGDMPAADAWKIYLATDDIAKTVATAEERGAQIVVPPTVVADLGTQAVLVDPTGATVGAWQPATFPGFAVLEEPGTPSWFELQTADSPGAVSFYRTVFHLDVLTVGDTDDFRYTVLCDQADGTQYGGIMDAQGFLPEGVPGNWAVYWEVADIAGTVASAQSLGGSVVADVEDTPYGRIATLADPTGAVFKLRKAPS